MERKEDAGIMQILFPPDWLAILSYIILWPAYQVSISALGNHIRDERFRLDSFWFRGWKFEDGGKFYKRFFRIHKWKRLLPDGAKMFDTGFPKGELNGTEKEYLEAFIKETCRAEASHWIQILPFWVFGLWSPPFVIIVMLVYSLVLNMPCIIAQRYNRPRLIRLYERKYGGSDVRIK